MSRSRRVLGLLGRALLWAGLVTLLVRGALVVVMPTEQVPAASAREPSAVPAFPNDEALAFTAAFARVYLTYDQGAESERRAALARFFLPALEPELDLALPESASPSRVVQATPAGSRSLGRDRALVTVAVELAGTTPSVRYLSVPLVRDEQGGIAVSDYPAFVPGPRLASVSALPTVESLDPTARSELSGLLARFFVAYLSGGDDGLAYFGPPGAHLRSVGGPYSGVELVDLGLLDQEDATHLLVAASVRATDRATRASFLLRYRVALERRGRWYVAAVNAN